MAFFKLVKKLAIVVQPIKNGYKWGTKLSMVVTAKPYKRLQDVMRADACFQPEGDQRSVDQNTGRVLFSSLQMSQT